MTSIGGEEDAVLEGGGHKTVTVHFYRGTIGGEIGLNFYFPSNKTPMFKLLCIKVFAQLLRFNPLAVTIVKCRALLVLVSSRTELFFDGNSI